MTRDELYTKAVEALRVLGTSQDDGEREEYLNALLVFVYQDGQLDMQAEIIEKNNRVLQQTTDDLAQWKPSLLTSSSPSIGLAAGRST